MNGVTREQFYHRVDQSEAERLLSLWPGASRKVASDIIDAYGLPHEATETMMIWRYNGTWKRTVVHRNGVQHNIPHPHIDLLEQTVDAKVSPEIFSEVAKFDGSIILDKTRGEMTSYCESERANTLMLNLAHDIIIGMKTAKEARDVLMKSSDFFHSQLPNPLRESLQFTSTIETGNPDMASAEPN